MKYALAACLLLLAGCNQPAPEAPPEPAPAPTAVQAPPPSALAPFVGRYGVTATACAPTNTAEDGVFTISETEVRAGPDVCAVTSAAAEGEKVRVTSVCKSGEGGTEFAEDFVLARTLTGLDWTHADGKTEPCVQCPG